MATPLLKIVCEGQDELAKQLDALDQKVRNQLMRRTIRRALKTVEKAAKESVPVRTGHLKSGGTTKNGKAYKGIHTVVKRSKVNGEVYGYVEAGAPHACLVEFGTRLMAAQPFLRPAMDAHREEALTAIAVDLQKIFDEVIGK